MGRALTLLLAGLCLLNACQTAAPPGNNQNQPPSASFTATPSQGTAPLQVSFNASASTDPDGSITSYSWDFGDGNTGTGITTSHTYQSAGTFTVELTVTDNQGVMDKTTRTVTVEGADGNQPPSASFTASPSQGIAPLQVNFNASASTDPDGSMATYSWDFGDGNAGSGVTTSHTYLSAGTFTIKLTVTDNQGATASTTKTVTVTQATTDNTLVASGASVPGAVEQLAGDGATLGIEAVYLASQLGGGGVQLITTGTLTQNAQGSWSYNSDPTDRLRIVFASGGQIEYFVTALNGNFDASAGQFLFYDHEFDFRIVADGAYDLTISLQQVSGQNQKTVQGSLVSGGITYTVDLTSQGTFSFNVDTPSHEANDQIQGTITAEGFSLTVDEVTTFKLVGSVINSSRTINNSWTIGSDQYVLSNGFIRRSFTEGKPSESDFWRAEGTLTRNGVLVGGISSTTDIAQIVIFIEVDGERTTLEAHTI